MTFRPGRTLLVLLLATLPSAALAGSFTVTSAANTADDNVGDGICHTSVGPCTLRAAMQEAAATATGVPSTISFNVSGAGCAGSPAVCTITLSSSLPNVTRPLTVNGYTQPGSSANTAAAFQPGNAVILIEVNGAMVAQNGFRLVAGSDGSVIRGLAINGCTNAAVEVESPSNVIAGNYIGTDPLGQADGGGLQGVVLNESGNMVGGTAPADRNVISGYETQFAVSAYSPASSNTIYGNFIGTNAAGTASIASNIGIYLSGAILTAIGGTVSGAGNLISGNTVGISLNGAAITIVYGNRIGTDASGANPLPNVIGMTLYGAASGNVVGGTAAGQANTIAFHGQAGVSLISTAGGGNAIRGNSIFGNTGLGIDLNGDGVTLNDAGDGDAGPNNLQNYPVLTAAAALAASTTVQGTLNSNANKSVTIEFFSNLTCHSSGYGEGRTRLGQTVVMTDVMGNASFNVSLPVTTAVGSAITATATDSSANTSEFSLCRIASPPPAFSLVPDGRATTVAIAPAGNFYRARLLAGRSYSVEVDAPFDGAGATAGAGPQPTIAIKRGDGNPLSAAPTDRAGCAAPTAARLTLTPTSADAAAGPVTIQVVDVFLAGYKVRTRAVETTMFVPRWSVNGYTGLVSVLNTSSCSVSGAVALTDSSGATLTSIPFTLNPASSTQFSIPTGLSAVFGAAYLTHDGPPGAITGGIYMVQPGGSAAGANFRWPFLAVREMGSTDGR